MQIYELSRYAQIKPRILYDFLGLAAPSRRSGDCPGNKKEKSDDGFLF